MTLRTTEVPPDHAVRAEADSLCCPRCGCHVRLALILDQPIDYPETPKTVSVWTAPIPDTPPVSIEEECLLKTETLEEIEKRSILRAMKEAGNIKLVAAQILGIGRTTLYRRLKEYGFQTPSE